MIHIGILGAAEIAHRMFAPALLEAPEFSCAGVAASTFDSSEKKELFRRAYGFEVFDEPDSFDRMIERPDVDALYIPQPPALHHKWAKKALLAGKHVLVEKPSTDRGSLTRELVVLAREKGLVLQENYMFQYHAQLLEIRRLIEEGAVGELRLLTARFGFPMRSANDFRYNRALGGGALLDAGGYVVKLASLLLGPSARLTAASQSGLDGFEVDMFGSVSFENSQGLVFQGSFGMDCHYQCALEVWGSKGKLSAPRIFTAPPGFSPVLCLETAEGRQDITLPPDNHFLHSLEAFARAFSDRELRARMADDVLAQAEQMDQIRTLASMKQQ